MATETPASPSEDAVRKLLAVLKGTYGQRFEPGAAVFEAWAFALDGVTDQELFSALQAWVKLEKWPPTPADLRGLVPRFCRCRKCDACQARAYKRAVANIGGGGEDFGPEPIGNIVQRAIASGAAARLLGGPALRPALPPRAGGPTEARRDPGAS